MFLKECGRYHEKCESSFPCIWCDNKVPLRLENGTFAPHSLINNLDMNNGEVDYGSDGRSLCSS